MRGILSYRAKEGQKLEFYRDHIKNCNIIWFSKYRERVTGTISRRIARTFGKDVNDIEKNVEKALDVIITYHDLGKLTKIYQDYVWNRRISLGGFRHEHVSTYFVLKILQNMFGERNYLAYLGSACVYLHHEALILTFKSDFLRMLRTPQMDYLLSLLARIEDEDLQIVEGAEKEIEIEGLEIYETESINKINTALLTYFRCVDKNSILQSINDVLNRIDGSPIAPELRLLVSSLLLPLVEVDNNAGGLRE